MIIDLASPKQKDLAWSFSKMLLNKLVIPYKCYCYLNSANIEKCLVKPAIDDANLGQFRRNRTKFNLCMGKLNIFKLIDPWLQERNLLHLWPA